ncbi:MAG: GAF domain-containing sensor histidine kinase [Anaerolineaceae bacterium]|nr:GAF domain-containing sensor histidine kinase [Anaerolineaceae bacterium]MCB9100963.1 GAF domain-containing sensor histidine kinase [Anaerolineales bacterium]
MASTIPGGDEPKKLRTKIIDSQLLGWLANLPVIAWGLRKVSYRLMKNKMGNAFDQFAESAYLDRARIEAIRGTGLDATLQRIVRDVVRDLGYVAAMVAPYEPGDSLPVRAFYINPQIASEAQIKQWELEISRINGAPVSLTDPDIARSYRYKEEFKDNLSIKAVEAGEAVTSDDLYSLFIPVAPAASKPLIKGIQEALGIQQVIATPFFLQVSSDDQSNKKEIVGNLFAAKRGKITETDIQILSAFGRQAAAAIQLEQRREQILEAYSLVYTIQTNLNDETQILRHIARGVVDQLGYVGAMVASYEKDDSLPVRAFYIDPQIASGEQIKGWEADISRIKGTPVSLTDPDIARSYRYKEEFKDNLSIKAVEAGEPVTSDDLYSLFTPVAPFASKPIVDGIQQALGIQQVIAAPFFLEITSDDQSPKREVKGNLFAASRSKSFTAGEIELLKAFGQQAAIGIRNAQLYHTIEELYRKSEERREQAQIFARMAFGATASLHELRNQIGAFRMFVKMALKPEQLEKPFQELYHGVVEKLEQATNTLDNLHEPWQLHPDKEIDVNDCLTRAMKKLIQVSGANTGRNEGQAGIQMHTSLSENLPSIKTSSDMLTEAFRVLIKNAIEAISEKSQDGRPSGNIWIESQLEHNNSVISVLIRDDGVGIKPENLDKAFEMRWSTKQVGMGFGLFWAKDYIEGLNGTIKVDSIWQEGTRFLIQLPVKAA